MFPLLLPIALATDPVFESDFALDDYLISEVICVEQDGPPHGALAIARSPLGWAHDLRLTIHEGGYPRDVDRESLMEWLPVEIEAVDEPVAFDLSVAEAPIAGDWLVQIEAAAYRRQALLAPNFTIVVDVSASMTTVHERNLPPLQDEPGPVYRPVTRLQIVRAALKELFKEAPENSRVSIVAMDALQARALLAPTTLRHPDLVYGALAQLKAGVVRPDDQQTSKVLDRISDITFDRCHDNKVILLTDHVQQLVQKKAVQDVARWARDDVEVWSFGVGLTDDVEPDMALLQAASGGASWLINARSDFEDIWYHILDPGGVVASDVFAEVQFPPGAHWKDLTEGSPMRSGAAHYSLGTLRSGEVWARVFEVHLPDGATVADLGATFLHERDTQHISLDVDAEIPPFPWASSSLRARALAAYWVNDEDLRPTYRLGDVLSHLGESSELRAWLELVRVRGLGGKSRVPGFREFDGKRHAYVDPFADEEEGETETEVSKEPEKDLPPCASAAGIPWLEDDIECE